MQTMGDYGDFIPLSSKLNLPAVYAQPNLNGQRYQCCCVVIVSCCRVVSIPYVLFSTNYDNDLLLVLSTLFGNVFYQIKLLISLVSKK